MSRPGNLVLGVVLGLAAGTVSAATLKETKLTARDGAAGDFFGRSSAISGSIAIVGADQNGVGGSAYLFDVTDGREIRKLTARDVATGETFGSSVAISGTTAIVGARSGDADGITRAGSAYVFDAATGTQIAKLTASDAAERDQFGFSVGISGSTAIVGAPFKDDDAGSQSGSAYLFNAATGAQLFKLTASDAAAFDQFGYSVAISGTTAIVGASQNGVGGSASVFNTTDGAKIAELTARDAAEGDLFGGSVAISGTTAIVGARLDDDAGSQSGSAYLFDTTTGAQLFKLTASDAAAFDQFGRSVAISGTTAIVGAVRDDDRGSAYLFDTTTGKQIAKLTASDAASRDFFGGSVAVFGDTFLVGAAGDDDSGSFSGSAYLYKGGAAQSAAVIPLPAGIWLMLAALGGLAVLGRRA